MQGTDGDPLFCLHYGRHVCAISVWARDKRNAFRLPRHHDHPHHHDAHEGGTVLPCCTFNCLLCKVFLRTMHRCRASLCCMGACSLQLMVGIGSTQSCFCLLPCATRLFRLVRTYYLLGPQCLLDLCCPHRAATAPVLSIRSSTFSRSS